MVKNYSVYLSTLSTVTPPTTSNSLAQSTWMVDWDNIFQGTTGVARVNARLVSKGNTTITYNGNLGTVRCNLQSTYTNVTNGVVLGQVIPQTLTSTTMSILMDSTQYETTTTCNIPVGTNALTVWVLDSAEVFQTNLTDWSICIYFSVE